MKHILIFILSMLVCLSASAQINWHDASGRTVIGKTGCKGVRTEALNDSTWTSSVWISAADAPVIKGPIRGGNYLAADGASWFVSEVRNEQKVVSAKIEEQDVIALAQGKGGGADGCIEVFRFQEGRLYDRESFIISATPKVSFSEQHHSFTAM